MSEKLTVWETLSPIDVGEYTEEKNGFTYLSWAWAWTTLKNQYPDAYYIKQKFQGTDGTLPYMMAPDGSAFVEVTIIIPSEETEATEVFPVLDYANKSISSPNSFQVNTALQRCLAKTTSILGLGAYIYAGEDLPPLPKKIDVKIVGEEKGKPVEKKASGADTIYEIFHTFMGNMDTVEKLESFYQSNIDAVKALHRLDAAKYERMISEFKAQKEKIINETNGKEKK